jgi:ElaB/YqjD/DUF883 family membrane-anchored ribosome-binding protein
MISKPSGSKDANTSSTNQDHVDDLNVTNDEARSGLAADHTGTEADAASAGIQQNLQVVKDSMVAAETAMVRHGREAAKASGEYVRDNVWNWY